MHRDNRCMYMVHVCCVAAVVKDGVFSIGVLKYVMEVFSVGGGAQLDRPCMCM